MACALFSECSTALSWCGVQPTRHLLLRQKSSSLFGLLLLKACSSVSIIRFWCSLKIVVVPASSLLDGYLQLLIEFWSLYVGSGWTHFKERPLQLEGFFYWRLCVMAVFDLLAHPQNRILYVRIGFITALYMLAHFIFI